MSQKANLQAIADAIRAKEGSTDPIPASTFAERIAAIQTGIQLPTLTNPGTAADLRTGKQLIDADGNPLTGTMPELAAQTIIPGASDQIIPAGQYLTGVQTIKGDANLLAENIKKDVTMFGLTGAYEGDANLYIGDDQIDWDNYTCTDTTMTIPVTVDITGYYIAGLLIEGYLQTASPRGFSLFAMQLPTSVNERGYQSRAVSLKDSASASLTCNISNNSIILTLGSAWSFTTYFQERYPLYNWIMLTKKAL